MKKIIFLLLLLSPAFVLAGDSKNNVYRTVADELLKNCEGTDKKIAVAGFSYSDGRDSRDGGVVAERMTTELVKLKKFKVIERKEIEKVFAELKFQRSGALTPDSAKEIGKLLGADWLVIGTLTELPDKQLELNTRLVGVDSAEILSASNTPIKKDWIDQYRKLLEEQNNAILKNAKDAQAFNMRGMVYADLGEYDNAIASFDVAISLIPTFFGTYLDRGYSYHHKGEYDKAIADYSKAIAIDPGLAAAYFNRGIAYADKQEYDKAIEDLSKAIAINPEHAPALSSRAFAYRGNAEFDKAIEDCSKAIAIDPKYAQAYINRGYAYSGKREYDKAIEDYSKGIKINPKNAEAYGGRGFVYYLKGTSESMDKAIKDCSMAIAIDSKYAPAYFWRGSAYRAKNEYGKAALDEEKYRSLAK